MRLAPPRIVSTPAYAASEDNVLTDDELGERDRWYEVSKTVETVRVENPEDSEQYVDIERRVTSLIATSDGRRIKITYLNG